MHKQNFLHKTALFGLGRSPDGQLNPRSSCAVFSFLPKGSHFNSGVMKVKAPSISMASGVDFLPVSHSFLPGKIQVVADENQGELSDEDEDLCPVECVREFKTDEEFSKILQKASETDSLVVVDFYRTSCGSCKYIAQGFSKLCKGSGDQEAPVIFLKHNVLDEYDEQSEVAERLRIRSVPLFHFYKNGVLLDAFPTRDKERIVAAILKYTSHASVTDT